MYIFQYILNIFKPGSFTRIHTDTFLFTDLLGHFFSVILPGTLFCRSAHPIHIGVQTKVLMFVRWIEPMRWYPKYPQFQTSILRLSNWYWENNHQNCWSGQIIIFHQPRFSWNKGIPPSRLHFGVRSCEVATIWPGWWFRNPSCQLSWGNGSWNPIVFSRVFVTSQVVQDFWKTGCLAMFILVKGLVLADQNV